MHSASRTAGDARTEDEIRRLEMSKVKSAKQTEGAARIFSAQPVADRSVRVRVKCEDISRC